MRLVLDTDVLVAAVRSDSGASRALLRAAIQGGCVPLVSVPLVAEYEAVLTRRVHLAAAGLTVAEVLALIDALVLMAEPVRLTFLWRPLLRDPDDDMVLETAINGRADRLVTFNRRHFAGVAGQFGLTICLPRDVVRELEIQR